MLEHAIGEGKLVLLESILKHVPDLVEEHLVAWCAPPPLLSSPPLLSPPVNLPLSGCRHHQAWRACQASGMPRVCAAALPVPCAQDCLCMCSFSGEVCVCVCACAELQGGAAGGVCVCVFFPRLFLCLCVVVCVNEWVCK